MWRGRYIIKQKSFGWAVLLCLLVLQDIIIVYIPTFKYYDEAAAILCLLYFVQESIKSNVHRIDWSMLMVVIMMCVLAFLGNVISKIQDSLKYQLFDAFNIYKYVMVAWGASSYFEKYSTKKYLIHYLASVVKAVVVVSSVFMFLNWIVDIGMYTDYRYGVRTYRFLFSRVGDLYNTCVIWLVILAAEQFYTGKKKISGYMILTMLNMCATMRTRAFAFTALFIALHWLLVARKKTKIRWWHAVLLIVAVYWLGKDQIEYYLMSENTARFALLKYGIVTAMNYFPLGSGFATYGTAVARDTYSSLYTQYNFSNYYGLADGEGFLTDNYWPAIIGEFGFIGAAFNAVLLFLLTKKLLTAADNSYSKLCVLFGLGTLLIASTASSSFLACTQLMTIICLVCKLNFSSKNECNLSV